MEKFVVFVRSEESTVNLKVSGCEITVYIPASDHTENVQLHKNIGSWSVDLLHNNPGFGKPYLLKLTNQEKNDEIKVSIVPERDFIKTNLLHCTFKSLTEFFLTGPNVQVVNSQYDNTLTGVSLQLNSVGNVRISSHPLQVKYLDINVRPPEGNPGCSSDVYVDTGAVIKCQSLTVHLKDGSNVFLNGTITCTTSFDSLNVRVISGNLHVSVSGILGQKVSKDNVSDKDIKKTNKKKNQHTDSFNGYKTPPSTLEQNSKIDASYVKDAKTDSSGQQNTKAETNKLYLEIVEGNLTNFGKICAKEYLLLICDTLMLCEDSEYDTASRGFRSYTALQKESGFLSSICVQENPKQSSSSYDPRLLPTVRSLDSKRLISILNEEVDPTVEVDDRSIYTEFNNICREGSRATYDKDKVEKELIRGSLNTWNWKHGVISSTSIKCVVKQDINDCSQLQSKELALQVDGTARLAKPWTWKCGELSGFVKGDFLFHDNAVLTKFNKLCVVGNFRIFRTSSVRVQEGGELIIGEEFENNSVLISDKNLSLTLGYLKQARESSIISNEDLLVALYKKIEDIWFGNIYAYHHLFIQVQERVVCDALCVAKEVHLEFFGERPQFVVTQVLLAEEGSLNMWAENEYESANFLLSGKLNSHGIQAETASVCVLPGGVAELTCESNANEVDVITRWLNISNQAVMISKSKGNKKENYNLTTNVYCEESLVVDGALGAFGSDLNIYCEVLRNNGVIKLSTIDRSSSLLHIECDKELFNSGTIGSEGNMTIDAMIVSNETGVIKSSPSLRISTNFLGATSLCGQILVDKQLFIHSKSEKELMLNVTGGKSEGERHFIPPDQLEVKCKKADLKIDSSIICPEINQQLSNENEGESSIMVLSLHKCLSLTKECKLEDVRVQFIQIEQEDNNNSEEPSKFVVLDSFKVKSLYLSSGNALESDVVRKGTVSFGGSNKSTVVDTLEVDEAIREVIFGTESLFVCTDAVLDCEMATIKTDSVLECLEVHANNVNVYGQMRCMGRSSEEKKSLVKVKNTFSVDGSVECVGSVELFIGESFVQAEDGNIAVEGDLLLKVVNENGHLSLEGSTKGQKESIMKVESDNIKVSGCLSEVHTLSLNAEMDMALSEKSRISCEEIDMKGEWITTAGTIDGFNKLSIEPWAIMNSGIIDSENDSSNIFFQSDLTMINSGICRAQMTYLEAPFLLNLPGKVISDVNDVTCCQLVGKEQLKLESIACFLGGSSLRSCKRYENLSVLLFKFLTYVACTPDSKSLEAWSKAAESLRNIQSQITPDASKQDSTKLKTLMNSKDIATGTEVDLRIARMYDMVNDFVAEILKNGIKSFDATKLVHILTIESERYTKINILKENLLKIPKRARAIRELMKKRAIKIKKSVRKKFGFSDPKMQSQQQDGIFESGFYSFGEGVTFTDFLYEAAFVEVFHDEGFLFAVDFLASAKDVVLSKREKKAVAMVIYSEKLNMENVDAVYAEVTADEAKLKNIKTKTLDVNARESVEAEKITSDQLQIQGGKDLKATEVCAQNTVMTAKDIKLKDIKSTNSLDVQASKAVDLTDVQGSNVHVQAKDISATNVDANTVVLNATNNAHLEDIDSDNLNVKSSQTIVAESIKGKSVHMESNNINVSKLDAKNTSLNAANNVRLKNIQADNLQVQATKTVDAENIKGKNVHMESRTIKASNVRSELAVLSGQHDVQVGDIKSKTALIKSSQGKVKATGKIELHNAKIESQNGIDLAYNKNGSLTADHQFKSLQMKTNKINEVNKLLKGDGIYKDLKISDQLGLVVSDQDVIFSRCVVQQNYKLDLKAKSVNIDNASLNWSKGASITSDKTMKVNDSSITSRKSISLESKSGNVNMNLSEVKAGEIAKIEARKGSVSLTGTSISGDQAAIVKAKRDVIIDPVVERHSNSSSRRGFFSSSRQSSSYSTVTKSGISSSKGIVAVEAEEGKVQATATEFTAEKGVFISAEKDIIIQDKITIREEVSVKKNWFRTKRSVHRTEESHKSSIKSRGPVCMKSKGNIRITGTDSAVQGDMFLEAAGTVLIQDRILSKSEETHTSGFSFSPEKGLSCGESNKQLHQQQLAGSKLQVGGNLVMKGKNVFVKNAMEMDTKNLVVDAKNVKFEGAELNNSYSERSSSVNFGFMSFDITEEKGWGKEKKIINHNINVLGQTNFINCKNVTLAASNLDTGAISGYVENLNVISKQTEVEAKKQTETLGFVVSGCLPVPSKYGASESCDKGKFVENSSGIHVRGSINNEFKVGTVYLKGSAVTANGDIAKFVENVISEKITSYRSQTTSGFNFGISKTSVEFGIHQSEKFMEMEHNATIGSFSGTVANEVKQSVNTDLSKHSQITQMRNSNLGFNVRAGKDGGAASLQVDDVGVGFSASKHEIGVRGQVGDKGFSASGGSSGASLSLQNGENSIGVGLTNQGIDMNIRSGDTAIGASLGKNAISATVQSKDVSLGASSSNGSTTVQTKIGDFQSGITRNKNLESGERSTSAYISKGEFEVSGATSKHSKSFALKDGEYQTKFSKEKDAKTGKSKYDGNLKLGDAKLEASYSKDKKSLGVETPEFQTKLNKEKDSKTGKSKYDGNIRLGDAKLEASYSKDKQSFGLQTLEFQTKLNKEKDSKTGKSKYDGNVGLGDAKLEASYSKDKQSFGLETSEFQTKLNKEKDSKTGKSKYDGNIRLGDAKLEASYSKDKQSFGLQTPEFQTKFNKEKDSKTGKSKYDGNVRLFDAKLEASYSKDKQSFGLATPEFQTKLNKEKDSETGKSKYDGNVGLGDAKLEASYSKDKQSFGLETSEFQTKLNKEKDSKTGKTKYDGNIRLGDAKLEASYSKDKQSFGLQTPEFQTKLNKEKDSKTGKSKYDGNVGLGDAKLEASYSKDKQSFELETPEFQTKLNKEKDSKTGKSKYDGNVRLFDAKLEASYSKDKQSFGLQTPEFQTKLNKEKDSKTGKSKYDGNLALGDVKVEASSSKDKTSFGLETPEFQTKLNKEKDSKTGKSKYDGNLALGDAKLEASYSKDKTSFGLATPEFQTELNREKDSKTGKSKYDGNLKLGDVKVEASSSKDKTSFGLETPELQTELNKEKDSKTGTSKYDGNLKLGDVKVEASSSKNKKSFGLETPEFQTKLNKEKDSKTGKSKYDGNLALGDVKVEASSSKDKTSFGLATPEFQTELNKEKDSKTGKSKYDGNLKLGDVKVEASSSKDKTSFGLETPEFQTELNKEKDSKTGKSKYDGNLKLGDVKVEASSSKDKTSFGLETPEFQTELNKEKDSKTGKSKYDGNLKLGDVKVEASSSKDKKCFGLETPELQTELNKEKDSKTGKSKYDGNLKLGDVKVEASSSKDKTSFGLETPEFQTELNKEKDSKTGKSKYDGNLKLGDVKVEASSSKDKTSFGLATPEFQTELNKEKDSKTGKSKYDGNLKLGDVKVEASSSKDKTSFGLETPEFQTELNKEKDSKTGKSKYDGNLKLGDVKVEASSSKDKKCFGLETPELQTELNKEKYSKTGKSKYDGNLKLGDVKVKASSSKDKKCFGLETPELQIELNKEKDSKTGKSKYDGNLKLGDVKVKASSSKDKKCFGLETPELQIELNKEKDSKTGKSKYDGNLKLGDVKVEASSSKDKTSFGLETPEFQTELNKEKDSKTGKSKYDGNLKLGDVKVEASSSKDKTYFGLETPEFQTELNKEKDSKTGKSKYDGNLKLGDVKVEASSSKDKKSFGLETPEFQTNLNKEKDSKTRKSKHDGNLTLGDAKLEASYSKDKKSFGLHKSPEFQTELNKEKDSKTAKSKYDGNLKLGDVKVEASSSKDKKSFVLEMPEFQTEMNKETTSTYPETKGDGIACTSVQSLE